MLPTHRFDLLVPKPPSHSRRRKVELPSCAWEAVGPPELGRFPAFELMRLARDWVEGDDELGVEVWQEDQPERYYEDAEHAPLCAAHAVVGHLCAAPEDAVLRGEALLDASFRRYWGSSPLRTPALPAHAINDERPPQWSR